MKDEIVAELNELALASSGEPHTFTLIEHLRDNLEKFQQRLRESKMRPTDASTKQPSEDAATVKHILWLPVILQGKEKIRKENLTKSQKRRQMNHRDISGNLPRGWNWIDVIKHLRQTGSQETSGF